MFLVASLERKLALGFLSFTQLKALFSLALVTLVLLIIASLPTSLLFLPCLSVSTRY